MSWDLGEDGFGRRQILMCIYMLHSKTLRKARGMLALMRKIFQWEIACLKDLVGVRLYVEGEGAGEEPMPCREWRAGCGYSFEEGMG